jgi:transglutaminase-like putative cysteine protease
MHSANPVRIGLMDRGRAAIRLAFFTAALAWGPAFATRGGDADGAQTFRFRYETRIGPIESGRGPVHVFIPLAKSDEYQTVHSRDVESSLRGRTRTEARYGNLFWHGVLARTTGETISVRVTYRVERLPFHRPRIEGPVGALRPEKRERFAVFLAANERVPVADPVLKPILAQIRRTAGSDDHAVVARAIYDWVVENLEYKKVGTGWGNGDTYWACSQRYGNCTDFHSLFNSLARTEGIPARFEIGFPVPEDRPSGRVSGYHCWTRFYLDGAGWLPIDASEAFKHPERKGDFYGRQPADRIHLTTGRDLQLGEGHVSGALNYFVYPHVEVAGRRYDASIVNWFSFQEVTALEEGRPHL